MDNKPVLITGKLDQRDEEPSILVDQISNGQGVEGTDNDKFFIKVPKEAGENELKKLKDLLLSNPGGQKVTLVFNGNKNVELPIKVAWSKDLAQSVTQIFTAAQNLD